MVIMSAERECVLLEDFFLFWRARMLNWWQLFSLSLVKHWRCAVVNDSLKTQGGEIGVCISRYGKLMMSQLFYWSDLIPWDPDQPHPSLKLCWDVSPDTNPTNFLFYLPHNSNPAEELHLLPSSPKWVTILSTVCTQHANDCVSLVLEYWSPPKKTSKTHFHKRYIEIQVKVNWQITLCTGFSVYVPHIIIHKLFFTCLQWECWGVYNSIFQYAFLEYIWRSMTNGICGCEKGGKHICWRFLKGGFSSFCGDENTRTRGEKMKAGSDAL